MNPEENKKTKPAKEERKAQKQQAKAERKQKYPDKIGFLLGLVVLIFAVLGIVLSVVFAVNYIGETTDTGSEYANYNVFLEPVAAVDPDPFDDISSANTEQLINTALWNILSKDTTPDTYSYSNGFMLIPAADVKAAYSAIFGTQPANSLKHQTVQGYNTVFEYDATAAVYKIPVTTISPIYTPQVISVEKSGTSLEVTVEYLSSESWLKDDEGNMLPPEPDKTVKITMREENGSYFINAVQTISATIPEVVLPEGEEIEEPNTADFTKPPESTTIKTPEKSTLGGRV